MDRWQRLSPLRRALVVLAVLVAAGTAFVWWNYPAHRIARQFRALDLPASFHLTNDEPAGSGWICFDDCPTGYRYWASDLSEEATVEALTAAFRESGVTLSDARLCDAEHFETCHYEDGREWLLEDIHWHGHLSRGGADGYVAVGRRGDGRVGVEIWFEDHVG